MGSRQFIIVILFIVFFSSCYLNRNLYISSLFLTEDSMIIEIEYRNVKIFDIRDVNIDYKNIPIYIKFSENEEVTYDRTDSKIVISLDLTDIVLFTNEKAELTVAVSGGFIYGDIVIEDLSLNLEQSYTFPSEVFRNLNINILNQGYGLNI